MRWAALPPSLLLLWFFFASSTGPTAPEPSNRVAAKRAASCEEFTRKLGELFLYDGVEVILATVPDPLTSGLSYSFDLQVDAIQRALAQARYTLERFWLPWSQAPDSGTNCYGYPGFLLGTRAPADGGKGVPEQILVLLVGETPTAGINIAQMHCAKNVLSKADGKIPPNNFDRA